MAGTSDGGKRAAEMNKERWDAKYAEYGGFYAYIGRKGGQKSRGGGFTHNSERAREAGRKGGLNSRRKSRELAV